MSIGLGDRSTYITAEIPAMCHSAREMLTIILESYIRKRLVTLNDGEVIGDRHNQSLAAKLALFRNKA